MWRTPTSKADSLTGILIHFTYKVDTYLANIILRDFIKKNQTRKWIFFEFCMEYGIMTPCFVMAFGTQNIWNPK